MNMLLKFMKNRKGSILMETVLVIPLYLAFLSGVFWVGDLILIRIKLTASDRVSAWSHGNRHNEMDAGSLKGFIKDKFFNSEAVGDNQQVSGIDLQRQPYGQWNRKIMATANLRVSPPPWTDGWRRSAMAFFAGDDSAVPPVQMKSREVNQAFMHENLMRAKNTFREDSTPKSFAETMSWYNQVYMDAWPEWAKPNNSEGVGGVSPCMEYTRFGSFVTWSE